MDERLDRRPEIAKSVDTELVIFDCDGVLVESEAISRRVLLEHLSETGLQVSTEEVAARFMRPRMKDVVVEVEAAVGRELGDAWIAEFEERRWTIFASQLLPIAGACDTVSALVSRGTRVCVATQAQLETTLRKLALVGLSEYFPSGAVFSADEVPLGKPHPGVFLHAAASIGVRPEHCVVIEDSADGVKAALRAGMQVFHYRSGPPALREAGTMPLASLGELPHLISVAEVGTDRRS